MGIEKTLANWVNLNEALKDADEGECRRLLALETDNKNRPSFKRRIHSRLNKVRADRERRELGG